MKRLRLNDLLSYRFTFMLVPHGAGSPRQINIHLSAILIVAGVWTGITFWGSYLSARHVDYWRTQVSNEVLRMKVKYLLTQLDESRQFIDEVKGLEGQLKNLLQYQAQGSLIKNDKPVTKFGGATEPTGGPTLIEENDVTRELDQLEPDMSWNTLIEQVNSMKLEVNERLQSYNELSSWIENERRLYRATPRGWPIFGRVTSPYGRRNSPIGEETSVEFHPGLDISGAEGTPVRATADGLVRMASWHPGYGNLVVLQHEFGYSTRFAHNSKILVKVGDRVQRGQVIALVGDTGRSTGPHCHYEVWRYNQRCNPAGFLRDRFPDGHALTQAKPAAGTQNQQPS